MFERLFGEQNKEEKSPEEKREGLHEELRSVEEAMANLEEWMAQDPHRADAPRLAELNARREELKRKLQQLGDSGFAKAADAQGG